MSKTKKWNKNQKQIPHKKTKAEVLNQEQILLLTHGEILAELQYKHTGLFNLSKKTGHKLLESLARTIFERLKHIMETNSDSSESCFKLSKTYRTLHPHFGDFQLILSTLHALQDAAAAPRAQINESDLTAVSTKPYLFDNLCYNLVKSSCSKYTNRIIKKVSQHIKELDCVISERDNEEEVARKRVRGELKKLEPFLPVIIKDVILNHFVPQNSPFHRIRVYGEPFLPTKEHTLPLLKRMIKSERSKVFRSDRMYNLLRISVPLLSYESIMGLDGTELGGAKIMVRPSDVPLYKVPASLIAEMTGMTSDGDDADAADMPMDDADVEEWAEAWQEN